MPDILYENVENLFASLPPTSVYRRPLIAHLTQHLTSSQAADLTGISTRTVTLARHEASHSAPHHNALHISYPSGVHHQHVTTEEHDAIVAFIEEQCPMRSGSIYRYQWCTSSVLYQQYVDFCKEGKLTWGNGSSRSRSSSSSSCSSSSTSSEAVPGGGGTPCTVPRSRALFDRIKKGCGIRVSRRYWGLWACAQCGKKRELESELKHLQKEQKTLTKMTQKEKNELQFDIQRVEGELKVIHQHTSTRTQQRDHLLFLRHTAIRRDPRRCLVVMDFAKFQLDQNVAATTADRDGAQDEVHDLVVVLEYWIPGEKKRRTVYLDFLCDPDQVLV